MSQARYTIHAGNRGKCFYDAKEGVKVCDGFDMSYGDDMDDKTRIWRISGVKEIDIKPSTSAFITESGGDILFYPRDFDHALECSFDGTRFSCTVIRE